MKLEDLPPLREVIETHQLSALKKFGQNFLLDLNLTRRIARSAGPLEALTVLEIGPGPGGLTRALLMEGAKKVIAIETDHRCLPALAEISAAAPNQLDVIEGDARQVDAIGLLLANQPAAIVANLPYNVGTILLIDWLSAADWPPPWQSLTLMFQREVADRIVARPGSKAYGRLSVLGQWRSDAKVLFNLPARAFTPPPKVDSAIVQIVPKPAPGAIDPNGLARITEAAFGQRRKMLRQSLKSLTKNPESWLEQADILPTKRAEELSVEDFLTLAQTYSPD